MNAIKHPQHIVAFDKAAFGKLSEGFNHMMLQDFLRHAQASFMIGRRQELETNEAYGQMLPYIVLYQQFGEKVRMFTYQRGKGIGEHRLLGNFSVGLGGHVDMDDVQSKNSVIDVLGTINNAMVRELEEEVRFLNGSGDEVKPELKPVFFGVINDTRDAVGRVHYGLVYGIKVPSDLKIECREAELVTVGSLNEDALKAINGGDESGHVLEGWSQLVIGEFVEFNELAKLV